MAGSSPNGSTSVPLLATAGSRINLVGQLVRITLPAFAAGLVVVEHGFFNRPLPLWALHLMQCLALMGYGYDLWRRRHAGLDPFHTLGTIWLESTLALLALIGIAASFYHEFDPYWRLVEIVAIAACLLEAWRLNVTLSRALARPAMLLPISFASLIAMGTLLLMTPRAAPHELDSTGQAFILTGQTLTFSEALFTATSAVCVTGLTVRNTAQDFSTFGQIVIASLIQLGGLGIIIFGSMIATLLGRSLSLKENLNLREMLNDQPLHRVRGFVRFIVVATLSIELIGAAVMFPFWHDPAGGILTFQNRLGMSLFHAVSAFCNAGFDITGNSLVDYRYHMVAHVPIVLLIVIGGLGFPALENLYQIARFRLSRMLRYHPVRPGRFVDITRGRLSLHTRIVLTTTLVLYLLGVLMIATGQVMPHLLSPAHADALAAAEQPGRLTMKALGGAVVDAHFMAISSRTAGFNAMPMDELQHAGRFTVMTLMMVGGSPGSTAGGFKTTVIALLSLSVVATVRQRPYAEAFGRTLTDALIRKAATIGLCYVLLVILATLLLCLSEPLPFESLIFEAISASTTTGLSLGITDQLTGFGRAVIIAAMFLGRVGPLALLGAMTFARAATKPYQYAQEDVAIG